MALKIRLARGGTKKRPFYRIVVAEASSPRDGRFVERIGSYNPMVAIDHPERLTLDGERAKYWMQHGAKPTDRVHKMMATLELIEPLEIREQPKKSAFGKKRMDREAAAAETAKAAAEAAAAKAESASTPEEVPETPAENPAEASGAAEAQPEASAVTEAEAEKPSDEHPDQSATEAEASESKPPEEAPTEESPTEEVTADETESEDAKT